MQVFQGLNDNFLSPRNLSVLSVDIVGTGMVAVSGQGGSDPDSQ